MPWAFLVACQVLDSEAPPPAVTPAPPPAVAPPPAPTVAAEVSVDLCGQALKLRLSPPSGQPDLQFDPKARVGPLSPNRAAAASDLRGLGWVAEPLNAEAGAPGLYWFDLPSDLTPTEWVAMVQPDFHCEGYGGQGHVYLGADRRPLRVIVRDPRFRLGEAGIGLGTNLRKARSALCPDTDCKGEWGQVPAFYFLHLPWGQVWFRDEQGPLLGWELNWDDAGRRPRSGPGGGERKRPARN